MKIQSICATLMGIMATVWVVTASAQVAPRQFQVVPPAKIIAPGSPTAQELQPSNPVPHTLYIWPGFDCVPSVTPYYEADQQTPVAAILRGKDLRVIGKSVADAIPSEIVEKQFARDLSFQCPVRIPPGSIITSMQIKGEKMGGNPAAGSEAASSVVVSMMQGNADLNQWLPLGEPISIVNNGPFNEAISGHFNVNSDGYPVFVNMAFSEPGVPKDYPRGWNFYVQLITVQYKVQ